MKRETYVYEGGDYDSTEIYMLTVKTKEVAQRAFSLLERKEVRFSDISTVDEYISREKRNTLRGLRRIARRG